MPFSSLRRHLSRVFRLATCRHCAALQRRVRRSRSRSECGGVLRIRVRFINAQTLTTVDPASLRRLRSVGREEESALNANDGSAEGRPSVPQAAPVTPQAAPAQPVQAITSPQPFVVKIQDGSEPFPWTMIVPSLITICGSVATIGITLWNSRKMLSQQNTHALTVLNEQKRRETQIWRGQRLWDQKRDTYIDLLKCLHTLEVTVQPPLSLD